MQVFSPLPTNFPVWDNLESLGEFVLHIVSPPPQRGGRWMEGYLVDPASSHMLVSKIKPCMCKYKRLNRETANGSLNQL